MLLARVGAWLVADGETVMKVPPVFRRDVGRIDVERFDGVDRLQHPLDLRPAIHPQQDFATGAYEGQRLVARTGLDRTHDVHARDDGAVVVRGPADEPEDAAGPKAGDAAATVEDLILGAAAEAQPVLDLLLDPRQLDMGERDGAAM